MKVLRKVIDRRQDFHATTDRPHGAIVETLECGHEHVEEIRVADALTKE